jgi:anti-sigma B factor antagonist
VQITSETKNNIVLIKVSGRMVLDESLFRLREHVLYGLETGIRRFVIDISEVSHLDSCGCGEVITAYTSILRAKGSLGFVNPTEHVRMLWARTKLADVFNVFDSVNEARDFVSR